MNDHCQHHHQSQALTRSIWIAFAFMIIELIGGWVANSLALITDALHLFTDVGAFLLSLVALRIAHLPKNEAMSFGYYRAEILGALASALSLWVLCIVLVYEAIMRLLSPPEVQGPIVFFIAIIGLGANLLMMRALHGSHKDSLNIKAAYLHVIGDLLGSIGVIISGAIIWFVHWNAIDPIITIILSLIILFNTKGIIKESVCILMERAPEGVDRIKLRKDLLSIKGVKDIHDLHIWTVSTNRIAMSVHLIAEDTHQALEDAHKLIEKHHHIHHMTIQVERPESFQSRFCYDTESH